MGWVTAWDLLETLGLWGRYVDGLKCSRELLELAVDFSGNISASRTIN